jgi:hypothetical protein
MINAIGVLLERKRRLLEYIFLETDKTIIKELNEEFLEVAEAITVLREYDNNKKNKLINDR